MTSLPAPKNSDEASLRIAFLAYRGKPHCGGQGVYTRHLTKALTDLGHHVEVLAGQPYPVLDTEVPLVSLPSLDLYNDHFPMRKARIWELKTKWDVAEALSFNTGNFSEPMAFSMRAWSHLAQRPNEFDLVHDNQCLGWGLLLMQNRLKLPVLSTIHHPITVDRRLEIEHARTIMERLGKRRWYAFTRMQTQVAKRMARVMTVSESSKSDIAADHKVDPSRIHVVPVGVDPELFQPVDHVQSVPGRIVTTASADVAMKGLKYLLEAVAKLRTERPIELVIIGKPKEDSASVNVFEELGLTDCVTWVHGVPDERIVELYSEAELAVVPSLYEGFSLPAIEAMSCGVPLIATTGGALPEVTGTHNETCFQVPPGDSEALASMIRTALDDPAARARIGHQGRQRVIDHWSWRHTAERTVEQYRILLSEHPGR
ncbi:MAG TPA: glycosyltransferase family 1 protein [Acidimicrobiia bacterium]|jgi:glycosyltransferase involved in cell wall biosynthesis|nr:glycosyltransferase family 1 protein [Acidimicrobiia bacterium]HIL46092.1 glycosyltransferase family 1 protein [Acidimicrobiia bacterium]